MKLLFVKINQNLETKQTACCICMLHTFHIAITEMFINISFCFFNLSTSLMTFGINKSFLKTFNLSNHWKLFWAMNAAHFTEQGRTFSELKNLSLLLYFQKLRFSTNEVPIQILNHDFEFLKALFLYNDLIIHWLYLHVLRIKCIQ